MDFQDIIALSIVAAAVVLLVVRRLRAKCGCGGCSGCATEEKAATGRDRNFVSIESLTRGDS